MTLTAELLDPGDDNWTMGDSNHVFGTEEAFYPRLYFKSFLPVLNDVVVIVEVLNIATKTQSYSGTVPQLASTLANNVEENVICGSEGVLLQPTWRHQLDSECNRLQTKLI